MRRPATSEPAAGLGEQLTPDLVAADHRRDVARLLLRGRVLGHDRAAHAEADAEEAGRYVVVRLFLVVDDRLDHRPALAAVFGRPVAAGVAGLGLEGLPFLGQDEALFGVQPATDAGAVLARFGVGAEPGADFVAICGLFRGCR